MVGMKHPTINPKRGWKRFAAQIHTKRQRRRGVT